MYPFPMTLGVGPYPMQASPQFAGLGDTTDLAQQPQPKPVISDWGYGAHIAAGAVAGLAAGWLFFKK